MKLSLRDRKIRARLVVGIGALLAGIMLFSFQQSSGPFLQTLPNPIDWLVPIKWSHHITSLLLQRIGSNTLLDPRREKERVARRKEERRKKLNTFQNSARPVEAIPLLIQELKRKNGLSADAHRELARIGPGAVPFLVRAIKDNSGTLMYTYYFLTNNRKVVPRIIETLSSMGPTGKEAVPAIIEVLKRGDKYARRSAVDALGELDPNSEVVIVTLIEAFEDPDSPAWLESGVSLVSGRASVALRKSGDRAVPHLIRALQKPRTHCLAAGTLGEIGPEAREAIPVLTDMLRDRHSCADRGLAGIGLAALPAVLKALKDEDPVVRSAAASAVGRMGYRTEEPIPALIKALKDKNSSVRSRAAWALGQIRLDTKEVVSALRNARLWDKNEDVQNTAFYSLRQLEQSWPPEAYNMISYIEQLRHRERAIRGHVARRLGWLGPVAERAVPHLIETLNDLDPYVRAEALRALKSIGTQKAKRAVNRYEQQEHTRGR